MAATPKSASRMTQIPLLDLHEPSNSYKKAVEIVHSRPSTSLSLLQGKVSNAWLKNAIETEPDADGWWSISIAQMATDIDFDSHNRKYLRESALDLMKVVFEYDMISSKDKRLWKASVLFPDIEIHESHIRYNISKQLRPSVLNPNMYALVDLNVLRRFKRASSIPIYEHCVRFVNVGQTAVVKLDTFRDIVLGSDSDKGSYAEFKYFRAKVLAPSIAEINTLSDIEIGLATPQTIGRRVQSVQFTVKRKSPTKESINSPAQVSEIVDDLIKFGISESVSKKLAKQYSATEIKAAAEFTRTRQADTRTSLANPAAYFRTALENGWAIVDTPQEKPVQAPRTSSSDADSITDLYRAEQAVKAKQLFSELDDKAKEALVSRYNDQQATKALQYKLLKPAKAATAGFLAWIAMDTWGPPSTDQLLRFAAQKLAGRQMA